MLPERTIFGDANAGGDDVSFNRSKFENFDAWGVEHDFLSILEPVSVAPQLQLGATLAAGRSSRGESGIGRVGRIGDEDAKQNHPGTENESPRPVSPRLR